MSEIIIEENNLVKIVKIDKWIDKYMEINLDKVEQCLSRNMELLTLKNFNGKNNVYIPTIDEYGNISWKKIIAITRQNNEKELYEIKTKSGRTATIAENRSLIAWNLKQSILCHTLISQLKIGDFVAITRHLPHLENEKYSYEDENKEFESKLDSTLYPTELANGVNSENFPNELFYSNEYWREYYISEMTPHYSNFIDIEDKEVFYKMISVINMTNIHKHIYCDINQDKSINANTINFIDKKEFINRGYRTQNDVVLDPIVEINKLDSHANNYSLILQSSIAFSLANGLYISSIVYSD